MLTNKQLQNHIRKKQVNSNIYTWIYYMNIYYIYDVYTQNSPFYNSNFSNDRVVSVVT